MELQGFLHHILRQRDHHGCKIRVNRLSCIWPPALVALKVVIIEGITEGETRRIAPVPFVARPPVIVYHGSNRKPRSHIIHDERWNQPSN